MGLGAPELLIMLAVVLLLFGGAKLPKLARSLGEAKNEFERGTAHHEPTTTTVRVSDTPVTNRSDTVTVSRATLDELIEERAREASKHLAT